MPLEVPPQQIAEIADLLSQLRADRLAGKEKERGDRWTRFTSISIVIIAVLTALATLFVGKYSSRTLAHLNDATYYEVKASDQWTYYQAKSIKQNLYEVTRDQTLALSTGNGAESRLVNDINARLAHYEKEKGDLKLQAQQMEAQRDASRRRADESSHRCADMQLCVALFQIAIALSSISLVAKRKRLWETGLAVALLSLGYMLYIFLS